jgi:hypothetical protein
MTPFEFSSYYDTYKAVSTYHLRDVAEQITCPLPITAPANETYWPLQSQQLCDLATKSPRKLVRFSESDGADLHCEPKGTGIRDLRVSIGSMKPWPTSSFSRLISSRPVNCPGGVGFSDDFANSKLKSAASLAIRSCHGNEWRRL